MIYQPLQPKELKQLTDSRLSTTMWWTTSVSNSNLSSHIKKKNLKKPYTHNWLDGFGFFLIFFLVPHQFLLGCIWFGFRGFGVAFCLFFWGVAVGFGVCFLNQTWGLEITCKKYFLHNHFETCLTIPNMPKQALEDVKLICIVLWSLCL